MSSKTPDLGRLPLEHLRRVTDDLSALRDSALAFEREFASDLSRIRRRERDSARNLVHYLAVRRQDLRGLQLELQRLGLSSLGRMEANVLPTLDAVLSALHHMTGSEVSAEAVAPWSGDARLRAHAARALGPRPKGRAVRIMVTMPSAAATDPGLIAGLLERGMDIMRINCAHDDPLIWTQMLEVCHREALRLGRSCRVVFDLAGPKLRTGPLEPGPEVLKVRPTRDALGRVVTPAQVWFTNEAATAGVTKAYPCVPLTGVSPSACQIGDELRVRDARGRARRFRVLEVSAEGCLCSTQRTAYLTSGMTVVRHSHGNSPLSGQIGKLRAQPQALLLTVGDRLRLTRDLVPGGNARVTDGEPQPAHVGCTLPEVFSAARPGHRIFFDDGKIAGVVRNVNAQWLEIEITQAAGGVGKLYAEKGINLPDTRLRSPALTDTDLEHLEFIATHADLVSLSFVRQRRDVEMLIAELERLGAPKMGIVLKIENRQAFENLPDLLLAALQHPPVAVMVARGDLGVEIGFERLAEVQEEILWLCEAAHVPVIWATQVLESLAKRGAPTRAEVTDAAMSGRAECVMLNKGPFIQEAVSFLDDVLRRMKSHQSKKTPMLRRLRVTTEPRDAS